ncbi:MAG: polyprenyl synthetase family protein, partial [Eubacterium sp.]|nr:polyprenyl synthetase family protein [Eubacterium sp.]
MSENMDKIKEYIESVIEGSLPDEEGHAKPVIEAMNYAVRGGGKRIRPLLMYLTYKSFCGDTGDTVVEPFMAALEMIHCYSLVHDDILDNDDLRRGKPSCHKQYGKDMALLAGDGLLNYAYETAARAFTMKPGDIDVEKA